MASASSFRLDQRISIAGKGIGTIAFIGKTEFADGKLKSFVFFYFYRWNFDRRLDWHHP